MNYPAEIIRALSTCIDKQEAMFHFTLPELSKLKLDFLAFLTIRKDLFLPNMNELTKIELIRFE